MGNTPWNLFAGIDLLIFLERFTCCRKSVQSMHKRTRQGQEIIPPIFCPISLKMQSALPNIQMIHGKVT